MFLLIQCIGAADILSWSDSIAFHTKSLWMYYSVITASERSSTWRTHIPKSRCSYRITIYPIILADDETTGWRLLGTIIHGIPLLAMLWFVILLSDWVVLNRYIHVLLVYSYHPLGTVYVYICMCVFYVYIFILGWSQNMFAHQSQIAILP